MSNKDALIDAIESVMQYEYMQTKAEIVEYYQDTYTGRGKDGWKQHLIQDLLPFTPRTGKDPAKNLAKRFDPQRLDNAEKKNSGQYRALGMTLPPKKKIPPESIRVNVKGKMNPSPKRKAKGEQPRDRDFFVDLDGPDAFDFVEDPSVEMLFEMYGIDGDMADLLEDGAVFDVESLD